MPRNTKTPARVSRPARTKMGKGRTPRPAARQRKVAPRGERSAEPAPDVDELIARRAYEIYLGRGGDEGHALEDWLRAEAELRE